jgi:ABC-type uncharacterized transport system permease subunit
VALSGWEAALISILAIIFALLIFSLLFILAGVSPLIAYRGIFSYAFANPFGLPLAINRSIFLVRMHSSSPIEPGCGTLG